MHPVYLWELTLFYSVCVCHFSSVLGKSLHGEIVWQKIASDFREILFQKRWLKRNVLHLFSPKTDFCGQVTQNSAKMVFQAVDNSLCYVTSLDGGGGGGIRWSCGCVLVCGGAVALVVVIGIKSFLLDGCRSCAQLWVLPLYTFPFMKKRVDILHFWYQH